MIGGDGWRQHALDVIARKVASLQHQDVAASRGELNLHRAASYPPDETETVMQVRVSSADLATPATPLHERDYLPGRGNPSTSTSFYRKLRRLRSIEFPFTVLPE